MNKYFIWLLILCLTVFSCNPLTMFGWKPELHDAAFRNDLETLNKLIIAGADINEPFYDNRVCSATPLHYAASNGSYEAAQLLIEHGANVNAITSAGDTPLHIAVGISPAWTCNIRQTQRGDGSYKVAQLLIEKGAKPLKTNKYGSLPIYNAIWYGRVDMIELFLKYGIDVNFRSKPDGPNLFMLSSNIATYKYINRKDSIEVAKLLLAKGADIDCNLRSGVTALHIACKSGNTEHVKFLIDMGFNINKQDIAGDTPLHYAAKYCYIETLHMLLTLGARVDIKNNDHYTIEEFIIQKSQCRQRNEMIDLIRTLHKK